MNIGLPMGTGFMQNCIVQKHVAIYKIYEWLDGKLWKWLIHGLIIEYNAL